MRNKCSSCGEEYEEYSSIEPKICPMCLWKASESNPENKGEVKKWILSKIRT